MKKTAFLILVASTLSGCSWFNPYDTWGESGYVWCNDRYLEHRNWDAQTEDAATRGYMYGLAAALTLQGDRSDKSSRAHWFTDPSNLRPLEPPGKKDWSGFEAATFVHKPRDSRQPEEIIIAFTGSNDFRDWATNFDPFATRQYDLAVAYTKKQLSDPQVQGKRVVLTGISLGGALAVHVLKVSGLEPFISEVWAINPSPKIYSKLAASESMKKKTWLAYSSGEALSALRSPWFSWLPTMGTIEPGKGQTAVFELVDSNGIYAHYRWGAARQMLWIADSRLSKGHKDQWTEPLEIIAHSCFRSCLTQEKSEIPIRKELQPTAPLESKFFPHAYSCVLED
ncbi:hypothetical protein GEV39_07705 [Pseudomonas sp. NY5710]|uniref:hypothetical protein n=1 Tax=Pseudomonas sp. NY5710 TaxID=2662033 RepID=UPI0015714F04|nr:hypothetical protein [Pseudomonas sp. NY5710]QKL01300.1 hypothetical protein GEV39_07705 [Pseudomonas sp. NY5710]